jgi:hypothetical protein
MCIYWSIVLSTVLAYADDLFTINCIAVCICCIHTFNLQRLGHFIAYSFTAIVELGNIIAEICMT